VDLPTIAGFRAFDATKSFGAMTEARWYRACDASDDDRHSVENRLAEEGQASR